MKMMRRLAALGLGGLMVTVLSGFAIGGDAYSSYSEAFRKTAGTGSLHVLFTLDLDDGETEVTSTGDMKVNASNEVNYAMEINGHEILQYIKDGQIRTIIDDKEMIASTDQKDQGVERGNPDGDKDAANEKADGTAFVAERFLEEFSGMLEAGKIKQLGVLDPIDSRYIKDMEVEKEDDGTYYTMTFPKEFTQIILDIITSEQKDAAGTAIVFSDLQDFSVVSRENSDGYLDQIEYSGYTTVTVPADLTEDGEEMSFDLDIDLTIDIQDPGTEVKVEIPA